ncbi:MAG: ATP-binding protein [Candidatus Onthomonas sp.]
MRRETESVRVSRSLFSLRSYLVYFLLISFVVTCCFLLFLGALQDALGQPFGREQIQFAARITLVNVLFLSLLCTLLNGLYRKFTIERPVRRILEATHRITRGDFSARIRPVHGLEGRNELDAIIENFNKMAEELSGIETLRTDFVANVSHELKTPLAVIQSDAAMLQDPDLTLEQREQYTRSIIAATRRLSGLITNTLRLNKLENQQIFPERREYDLNEQLCQCMLSFEDAWEEKQLTIQAELEEPVSICSDPELLELVWNNLISNAVKFTEPGGSIRVGLTRENRWAVVTVSDTGCGITPEVGRHIFERFYQGDTSHAAQGNGLGLALVKRVMDILGGEISVESQAGEGSTFTVRLECENP